MKLINNFLKLIISKQPIVVLLIINIIYFVGIRLIFGFTYESNDDPAFENMLRGVYWNTPITNFYFYHRGIAVIFVWLYQNLDIGINWYGFSLILSNFLSVFIISVLIQKRTGNFLFVILFLMINLQNVFLVSFTRVSLLLSFSAFLLLHFSYLLKYKKILIVGSLLIFLWAFLMRPNTAYLAFILLIPFLYSGKLNFHFFKSISYLLIPFLIGISLLFVVNNVQDKVFTKDLKNAAKITFPILDYQADVKTTTIEEENAVFEIKNWFFFHKALLNTDLTKDLLGSSFIETYSFNRLFDRTMALSYKIIFKPFFFFLLVLVLIFTILSKQNRITGILILLYFFSVLLSISMLLKMEFRILIPILTICLLFFIFYFSKRITNLVKKEKLRSTIVGVLILGVFVFQSYLYYTRSSANPPKSQLANQDLYQKTHNKTVFLMSDVFFNYEPLKFIPFSQNISLVPLTGWISYNEQTYKFQLTQFGTNDIISIFDKIKNRNDYIFVASEEQISILEEIFLRRGIKGNFAVFNDACLGKQYKLYRLEK